MKSSIMNNPIKRFEDIPFELKEHVKNEINKPTPLNEIMHQTHLQIGHIRKIKQEMEEGPIIRRNPGPMAFLTLEQRQELKLKIEKGDLSLRSKRKPEFIEEINRMKDENISKRNINSLGSQSVSRSYVQKIITEDNYKIIEKASSKNFRRAEAIDDMCNPINFAVLTQAIQGDNYQQHPRFQQEMVTNFNATSKVNIKAFKNKVKADIEKGDLELLFIPFVDGQICRGCYKTRGSLVTDEEDGYLSCRRCNSDKFLFCPNKACKNKLINHVIDCEMIHDHN